MTDQTPPPLPSRRELREQLRSPQPDESPSPTNSVHNASSATTETAAPSSPPAPTSNSSSESLERPQRRVPWVGIIVSLIVLALLGGATAFLYGPISSFIASMQDPEDYQGEGTGEVLFTITSGEVGEDIAANLVEAGVTKSFDAFYDLLMEQGESLVFQPGVFALKSQMSAQAALDALLDPANRVEDTLLIREGEVEADVYAAISEVFGFSTEELHSLAADPASFGLPAEARSLEGFLFPATYTFSPGISARELLQTLVNRSFQALDEAGVPVEERWSTIVLASLIQKEAGLAEDYYKVSRVFLNRLNEDLWPTGLLQSDATVAYGTGNTHRVSTTDAERADASNPYNTYQHPGMVIAPISNPGDLAIDAARNPADGPWLYFVTWNLETGETIFSTTAEEHDAGKEKWLEWMDAHPEYE